MRYRPPLLLTLLLLMVAAITTAPTTAQAAGVLCGTVRDATTAAPIPNAGIFLYQSNSYTGLHGATAPDGTYCIADIPPGFYDVQVRVNDLETAWVANVDVPDANTSVDISSSFPAQLMVPWPNPSSSRVNFGFIVGAPTHAELAVYDIRGRLLHAWSGRAEPGELTVPWNFINSSGRPAASGVYFVRLQVGDRLLTQSFVRVR